MFRYLICSVCLLVFFPNSVHGQLVSRPATQAKASSARLLKVITLQNADARDMQRIILELWDPGTDLRVSADFRTNSIIVAGSQDDLAIIEDLMARLDGPVSDDFRPNDSSDNQSSYQENQLLADVPKVKIAAQLRSDGPIPVIFAVPEGTKVSEGDLLVEFESQDVSQAIDEKRLELEQVRAAVMQNEIVIQNLSKQRKSHLAEGELAVELAELDLKKFKEGDRVVIQDEFENNINDLEVALEKQEELVRAGQGNKASIDQLKTRLALEKQKLKVFNEYEMPRQLKELEHNVVDAHRKLERLIAEAATEEQLAKAELQALLQQMKLHEQQLEVLNNELKSRRITAPQRGVVAKGSMSVSEGTLVRNRQVIMYLLLPNEKKN